MAQPVRAKKHLGQHFLVDESIARNIVEAMTSENSPNALVEIGPGTGVLTKYLIERQDFLALDVDRDSIAFLKQKYPQFEQKIVEADFLKADLTQLLGEKKFDIIGNFPYNISSQIMFRVLEHRDKVDVVVGMFQKEVAERLAEGPGSKVYGILSVLLQAFYEIEYLFTVEPHVFTPPPKVKSAVIRLKRNVVKNLNCDEVLFKQVVKTAFNQRRKTIRNSVKSILKPGADISSYLFDKRPEQLSVGQFVELTNLINH
jgi:16S rRNA (adenine1518-N6/adenine1519-N6)-dimethyltransferase